VKQLKVSDKIHKRLKAEALKRNMTLTALTEEKLSENREEKKRVK